LNRHTTVPRIQLIDTCKLTGIAAVRIRNFGAQTLIPLLIPDHTTMTTKFFASLSIGLIISGIVFGPFRLEVRFGAVNGKISIDEDELVRLPDWKAESDEPAFSIGQARKIATAWLNGSLVDKRFIEHIRLSRQCVYEIKQIAILPLLENDWYYKVMFEETPMPGFSWSGGEAHTVEVVVDMNGTVRIPQELLPRP
jgi:hypothetical protein